MERFAWDWERVGLTPPVVCAPCAEHFEMMLADLVYEQAMERKLSLLAFVNVEDAAEDWSI